MLIASGLEKRFGDSKVLDRLSITLEPGTITALLGPTGAGKSTLLRAIAMIEPPDSGTIRVDDTVFRFPADSILPKCPWPAITVVFQDLFLWPHLTNRNNILCPLTLAGVGDAIERLEALKVELNLGKFLDRYPNETSRGQRQVVAIARALALKPRYLFLDEVTASLDINRAARLVDTLRLRAAEGTGIMIITHQLAFAKTSAHKIAYMQDGKIVEEGSPSLLDSPSTESLRSFVQMMSRVA